MPTILYVQGWRLYFYSNVGLRREIRQGIFEHFDQLVAAWREHFGENRAE